jgi:two-component system, OmpR family, sensor histidine kinase BaeS
LGAVLLAGALSFLLMRRVLGPLRQMTAIADKISTGDYSGEVPMVSRDEIGKLAASFNRMAEGLQRIEQLRKTMMIDVAHELRTPLTNIRGYLEGIRDGVVPPSKETFDLLHEETLRLGRLVEDILSLAKADAARTDLRKTDLWISHTILETLDIFRPQFNAKEIKVTTDFSEDAVSLPVDPEKMRQVATNLLQNAWQYTPRGETVKISANREPEGTRFTFANPDVGLTQEDLPLIFERFYRGEKSRSREHGGSGIGLAIVKELIAAHGGRVGAELSQGEIRIWFSIPTTS